LQHGDNAVGQLPASSSAEFMPASSSRENLADASQVVLATSSSGDDLSAAANQS